MLIKTLKRFGEMATPQVRLLFVTITGLIVGLALSASYFMFYESETVEAAIDKAARSVPSVRADLERSQIEMQQMRLRLEEIEESLQDVQQIDLTELSPATGKKDGKGGATEPEVDPIDSLLLRLQNIAVRPSAQEFDIKRDPVLWARQTPMGAPVFGEISSGYGWRVSPFSGRGQKHTGIDISTEMRSDVTATADGIVRQAGWRSGYGLSVVIDHGGGTETLYAHLSRINVKVGEKVCRGKKVGLVGSTGNSTGPHLHYEVRQNGTPQNPERFMKLANLLDRRFAKASLN